MKQIKCLKITVIIMCLAMILSLLVSCGDTVKDQTTGLTIENADGEIKGEVNENAAEEGKMPEDEFGRMDADADTDGGKDDVADESKGMDGGDLSYSEGDTDTDVDIPEPGTDTDPVSGKDTDIQAGTLTAGEWNDLDNKKFWQNLLNENEWYSLAQQWGIYAGNIIKVSITDENNKPCFNAKVELYDEQTLLFTALSDIEGNSYLIYNTKKGDQYTPDTVIVYNSDGDGKTVSVEGDEISVKLEDYEAPKLSLDLMFMIDTTGSMGDELEYIKAELKDVVTSVRNETGLSVRSSVNFYRDTSDTYVVRYFGFKDDINESVKNIADQSASGGGDYPEAVHTALNNAINEHSWNKDAVKICFLVLDAPPHEDSEVKEKLLELMNTAAAQGIRIIPIASSGVDTSTELLCRSFAVMTGGTYIFLTNDSGIGNGHLEATVGDYKVEYLNRCITRVVKEYCGLKTDTANNNNNNNYAQ